MTRILLLNIPTAEVPTEYPPVAITRVMEGIDSDLHCELSFINLDLDRPPFEEIRRKIGMYNPHLIGISGILTPTYSYLKQLSLFIKEHFPHIVQVLGGEMAVIANIILSKTGIDFCCIGESEPTFSNLIRRLQSEGFGRDKMANYRDIKGLVFKLDGASHFTGYEKEDLQKSLRQFNYKLAARFTRVEHYIHQMPGQYFQMRITGKNKMQYFLDQLYPENRNKNMATVFTSKGCVVKCTFCHRFLKGYQVNETDGVIEYIECLRRDFDVGMILFSEENFGSDRVATSRIVDYLSATRLNWAPTATRARTLTEENARRWREAGCVHINSGLETASQKMLDVMEKKTSVEDNLNYLRRCSKHKIFTVVGTVIGMPGELEETIRESIENFATALPEDINMPLEFYANYVQAIPGTPVYEYARRKGLIGDSIEAEERYMESLYDMNACELDHYPNFTKYEKEEVAYWQPYVRLELMVAYIRKHGYFRVVRHNWSQRKFRFALAYSLVPWGARRLALKYMMVVKHYGLGGLSRLLVKKVRNGRASEFTDVTTSLRRVNREIPLMVRQDDVSTAILREGR